MNLSRLLLICFNAVALITIATASSLPDEKKIDTSLPLEENPNYVPYESDEESVDESNDTSDEENDDESEDDSDSSSSESEDEGSAESDSENEYDSDEEEDESKSMLNKALSTTNKLPSRTLQFIHKNRTPITIACALFAFRREIWHLIISTTTVPNKDGSRRARIKLSPTAILKIALFIDVMRKLQSGSEDGDAADAMIRPPGLPGLLMDLMKPSNSAFIPPVVQHYTFEKLNDRYSKDANALRKALGIEMKRNTFRHASFLSRSGSQDSSSKIHESHYNGTTIVMEMKGLDTGISSMETIRDQITFILNQHSILREESAALTTKTSSVNVTNATSLSAGEMHTPPQTEVVILLESPGGSATDYGLAANQIWRLRKEPGIKVVICVDKVAASGGYMMACMSSPGHLFAAPFAVVGSIGVIGQTINIHKSLQSWGVEPLVFRGGKDKAPVGLVGEITKQGVKKVQDMVDKTHAAFKRHVVLGRPHMANSIDRIATGDVWLAIDALEHGLIDGIITSDEYIRKKISKGEKVLKLIKFQRPRLVFGPSPLPGVLSQSFRSMVDIVQEFGVLVKKVNTLLEDQVSDISRVANTRATDIVNAQTFTKNYKSS